MFQSIPVVTRSLLIANIVLFGLQQVAGDWMIANLALWPLGDPRMATDGAGGVIEVGFQAWQLLSYGFLHGGLTHLAFNMFALWMFGGQIEDLMGAKLPHLLPGLRGRRCRCATCYRCMVYRRLLSNTGRFRWRVRPVARLRHVLATRENHAAVPTNSDAGVAVRHALRRA